MRRFSTFVFSLFVTLAILANVANAEEKAFQEIKVKTSVSNWMEKSRIESSIKKIDGVDDAEVNMESKTLTVNADSKKVSQDLIVKTLEEMNFTAELLSPDKVRNQTKDVKNTDVQKQN